MNKGKKNIIKALTIITLTGVGYITTLLSSYLSVAGVMPNYNIDKGSTDTLKIGIIGDSWASIHKQYDNQLDSMLFSALNGSIPVKIYSSGKGGAKTKLVYTNMFEDKDVNPNTYKGIRSSKPVLMQHPQYCVVFAGTNDAICKMGTDYYVTHMLMIIRHLLAHDIKPILVEIPTVDEDKAYKANIWNKPLRHITMWLTGTPFHCLDEYRKELQKKLEEENLMDKILFIPTAELTQRKEFLGKDGVHPTAKGYKILDLEITKKIANDKN